MTHTARRVRATKRFYLLWLAVMVLGVLLAVFVYRPVGAGLVLLSAAAFVLGLQGGDGIIEPGLETAFDKPSRGRRASPAFPPKARPTGKLDGADLRTLRSIQRGRVPSPTEPSLHVLLNAGLVAVGRDGYLVTELGHEALRGRLPADEFGLSRWMYLFIVVAVTLALWLPALLLKGGANWQLLLSAFGLGGLLAGLIDRLLLWRRRRKAR